MELVHLAPSPDPADSNKVLRVRDPLHDRREPLPPEGRVLPLTTYWRRRRARGDVHEVEVVATGGVVASPKAKSSKPSKS